MEDDLIIKKTNLTACTIGIILALLTPIITVAINVQQTQENKEDIKELQEKYQEIGEDIASINRSLEFLVAKYND